MLCKPRSSVVLIFACVAVFERNFKTVQCPHYALWAKRCTALAKQPDTSPSALCRAACFLKFRARVWFCAVQADGIFTFQNAVNCPLSIDLCVPSQQLVQRDGDDRGCQRASSRRSYYKSIAVECRGVRQNVCVYSAQIAYNTESGAL